jgi:hypothetical protein
MKPLVWFANPEMKAIETAWRRRVNLGVVPTAMGHDATYVPNRPNVVPNAPGSKPLNLLP